MNTLLKNNYVRLAIMAILSFIAMYILMYAMVDVFANVIPNLNQFYMAGLMAAPMVIIELLLMKGMYHNKKWNVLIIGASVILMAGFFMGIRQQAAISDKEFLKSMIPHHASAILMCEKADIKDAEIKELCKEIIVGQQAEIDWMKAKLDSLEK
jgi:uncharacterized protein (DUF305 family)